MQRVDKICMCQLQCFQHSSSLLLYSPSAHACTYDSRWKDRAWHIKTHLPHMLHNILLCNPLCSLCFHIDVLNHMTPERLLTKFYIPNLHVLRSAPSLNNPWMQYCTGCSISSWKIYQNFVGTGAIFTFKWWLKTTTT